MSVIWNGVPHAVSAKDGKLLLRAHDYQPSIPEKTPALPGPIKDVFNTPFAIIIGTASADSSINEAYRRKAEALIGFWKDWQRQPPRVFKDTELGDEAAARYSLILIGGAEANLIARRLAAQLPLEISAGEVKVGNRVFRAPDSCVQMIYPNPLNRQRYVLVVGATSAEGMLFWNPNDVRNGETDYTIKDGRIADGGQPAEKVMVAAGWFDNRWKIQDSLGTTGDPEVRAKCPVLRPMLAIDPTILESYAGRYAIPGAEVRLDVKNGRLTALVSNSHASVDLVPISDSEFYVMEATARISMVKDASGKTTSFKVSQNGQEFSAKKIE